MPFVPVVERHSLRDERDAAEVAALLDAHPCFVGGAFPGVGKTHVLRVYSARFKCLWVTPYNALRLDFAAHGMRACTAHDLLGLRVDAEGAEGPKRPHDVAGVELIVLDEIGCHAPPMLARLRDFMRAHADIRFHAAGDVRQLGPIDGLRFAEEESMAYYGRIIDSLFPHQIELREVKRQGGADAARIAALSEAMWTRPWDADARAAVLASFAGVPSLAAMPAGARAVTFYRDSADAVARAMHEATYATQQPDAPGLVNDARGAANSAASGAAETRAPRYAVGEVLRCTSYKRIGATSLYANVSYAVTAINWRKQQVVLKPVLGNVHGVTADTTCRVTFDVAAAHFAYVGSITGHSLQGQSVDAALVLFDTECAHMSRRWLWTALTRARSLDSVFVYRGPPLALTDAQLLKRFATMVARYRQQDARAGRPNDGEYITPEDILALFKACGGRCGCSEAMSHTGGDRQLTVDRLDNRLGHVRGNCVVACLACNRARVVRE